MPLPSNLPAPVTSFIGRTEAIAEIKRLLAAARLVTLTGPGGCGKSRLALQVATELTPIFPDGARWIDLAALTESALVAQVVAHALDIPDQLDVSPFDAICAQVRTKRMLLLLDNCEHLIDAVARLAEPLLAACPDVQLVMTSREALNIDGETAWVVPPLSIPTGNATVTQLERSDAIRLFLDRAATIAPSFALTARNAPAIAQICTRLDGIPLAIELAAARIKVLDPEHIASRLDDVFRLLTVGRRTALPRHQTLRAAVDWSYDLLAEQERVLLRRLGIFAGKFALETAEAVCAGDGIETADVLDILSRLVDKSLVMVIEREDGTGYRLLETLRQYSLEKLAAAGEHACVFARQRDWFLALAEQGAELEDAAQGAWLSRFDAEYDNLRAILRDTLAQGDVGAAARLCTALWRFWLIRGYLSEGRRWLEMALAGSVQPPPLRARALMSAAVLTTHLGEYDRATALFGESLKLAQIHDAAGTAGESHYGLGTVTQIRGDYHASATHYEESLTYLRAVGDRRGMALSLSSLGLTLLYQGELSRAVTACEDSLALFREIGDTRSLAGTLTNLGMIAIEQGDFAMAKVRCVESLSLRQRLGDRGGMAHTTTFLGRIAVETGDLSGAAAYYRDALALRQQTGETEGIIAPIEGLAAVASDCGDPPRATRLLSAAAALRTRLGAPLPPIDRPFHDRTLTTVRNALHARVFAAAWAQGESSALDCVIAEATAVFTQFPLSDEQPAAPVETKRDDASPAHVAIFGFGAPRVLRAGQELTAADWTYTKARELLFYLLLHGPSTKEQIGLALWPDASAAQLRTTFHPTLHHLRRALGGSAWIVLAQQRYDFNRTLPYAFDVEQFTRAIAQAQREASAAPDVAMRLLDDAVSRYSGKFLANATDGEWFLPIQDRLQQTYLDALAQLGGLRFVSSQYAIAADTYRMVIATDAYQESAHRELMRCYARMGERGLALRHFQTFAALLHEELGAAPALKTRALFERLRRGEEID